MGGCLIIFVLVVVDAVVVARVLRIFYLCPKDGKIFYESRVLCSVGMMMSGFTQSAKFNQWYATTQRRAIVIVVNCVVCRSYTPASI